MNGTANTASISDVRGEPPDHRTIVGAAVEHGGNAGKPCPMMPSCLPILSFGSLSRAPRGAVGARNGSCAYYRHK